MEYRLGRGQTGGNCPVLGLSPALRLRLFFFRFLGRDYWRARNTSCAFPCVFREFQRTFHDGRTAAGFGLSAGERGLGHFGESRGLAGSRVSASSRFCGGAEAARDSVRVAQRGRSRGRESTSEGISH